MGSTAGGRTAARQIGRTYTRVDALGFLASSELGSGRREGERGESPPLPTPVPADTQCSRGTIYLLECSPKRKIVGKSGMVFGGKEG